MGITIVAKEKKPKKKKRANSPLFSGGVTVFGLEAKKRAAIAKEKAETIEQSTARRKKRQKELQAEMSPYRKELSEKMRRNSLRYNMSSPDHRKMSGPELTVPKKRKRKTTPKAKGGLVKAGGRAKSYNY